MVFTSVHKSYHINTGKGCIVFKNGKYCTEDKKEIALLKNFPDVTTVKAVEKETQEEPKDKKE